MSRMEILDICMKKQSSNARMKSDLAALFRIMRQVLSTHTKRDSPYSEFRITVTAMADDDG